MSKIFSARDNQLLAILAARERCTVYQLGQRMITLLTDALGVTDIINVLVPPDSVVPDSDASLIDQIRERMMRDKITEYEARTDDIATWLGIGGPGVGRSVGVRLSNLSTAEMRRFRAQQFDRKKAMNKEAEKARQEGRPADFSQVNAVVDPPLVMKTTHEKGVRPVWKLSLSVADREKLRVAKDQLDTDQLELGEEIDHCGEPPIESVDQLVSVIRNWMDDSDLDYCEFTGTPVDFQHQFGRASRHRWALALDQLCTQTPRVIKHGDRYSILKP